MKKPAPKIIKSRKNTGISRTKLSHNCCNMFQTSFGHKRHKNALNTQKFFGASVRSWGHVVLTVNHRRVGGQDFDFEFSLLVEIGVLAKKDSRRHSKTAIIVRVKRLLLSLISGFLLPLIYTAIVGPLTLYIESDLLKSLLGAPVRWPIMILYFFVSFDALGRFPFRDGDRNWLLLYLIICDVILYSTITYVLLARFWKRKPSSVASPPQPPHFETR